MPITVFPKGLTCNPGVGERNCPNYFIEFYPDFILIISGQNQVNQRWTDLILISNYSNPNGLNGNARIAQNPEIQNGGGVHSRENTLSRDVHHITVSTI